MGMRNTAGSETSYRIPTVAAMSTDEKMLARIAALLRQAEGTDNPHEADAFMAAAQRLATATSIDLAVARSAHRRAHCGADARAAHHHDRGARRQGAAHLRAAVRGDRGGQRRQMRCRVELDVRLRLRVRRGHRHQLTRSTPAWSCRWCVRPKDYIASGAHKPTPTITARLNFQLAFGARVGQRLAEAREQAQREATTGPDSAPGTATRVAQQGHRAQGLLPRDLQSARDMAGDQCHRRLLVGRPARR